MANKRKVAVVNGPNLNLLGQRSPEVYGSQTLADIEKELEHYADSLSIEIEFFQSNSEGDLVTKIQGCQGSVAGLIINAAAYSHSSVAIRDAVEFLSIPVIEVHLSNIYRREEFRAHSFVSEVARGVICGLGAKGYSLALSAMDEII